MPTLHSRTPTLLAALFLGLPLSTPAWPAVFDARELGVQGGGVTDDTAALQKALNSAQGQTLFLPAGKYRVDGRLVLPAQTVLRGESSGLASLSGTVLLSTVGKGREDGPGCLVMQPNSTLERIAIQYPDQVAEGEPVRYPYAITAAPSTRIESVYLHSPYQGINLDFCHLNQVRDVWGEPLRVGINADHCSDISRIENVHFWPYYTNSKPALRQWVQDHGVAFQFGRSDWQYCSGVFSYGYHTGFRFYASTPVSGRPGGNGGVTNGQFSGVGADRCVIGIDAESLFAIGVCFTNSLFAPFGASEGSRAVWLRPQNTGNLTLTSCAFWAVPSALFQVDAGSLNLTACNIHEWALTLKDAACFAAHGGRLAVHGCTFNQAGKLAILDGDTTQVIFSGNMGTGTSVVHSALGGRLVATGNLPPLQIRDGGTAGPTTAPCPGPSVALNDRPRGLCFLLL